MKKYICAVFVGVLSFICHSSYSFGIDMLKKLKPSGVCRKCNLSGINLSGADLKGVDLNKANLKGAHLKGAHLERANLTGADMSGANLSGADLDGADLREANLQGSNATRGEVEFAILCHTKTPWGLDNSGCE